MEFSERFQRVYLKLVLASVSYDDAVNSSADLRKLSKSRVQLEDARAVMTIVRDDERLRCKERISPRYIDPSIGVGPSSRIGRVSAVFTGLMLAVALVLATLWVHGVITSRQNSAPELGSETTEHT
jgi:hypothetical protein